MSGTTDRAPDMGKHDANVFLPGCLGPVRRIVVLECDYDALALENQRLRQDADRYRKLLGWMGSNVPEGWAEVVRLGAVCAYVGQDAADEYLDELKPCSVGLAGRLA